MTSAAVLYVVEYLWPETRAYQPPAEPPRTVGEPGREPADLKTGKHYMCPL